MPRRKDPRIPDAVLDQLLAGADPKTVFDPNGLLDDLKKALAERVLNAEMDHHLAGEEPGNRRNGYGKKTVITDTGAIELTVPRDRQASFDPQLIAKYQRRFPGFDDKIISMYARGMSTREIVGHLRDLYGIDVSPDLISAVTDAVLEEVAAWQARPLEATYPLIFFDALRVKIRDEGLVRNKAVHIALGVRAERALSLRIHLGTSNYRWRAPWAAWRWVGGADRRRRHRLRILGSLADRSCCCGLGAEPDHALHVIDEVCEADFGSRSGDADGADKQPHRPFLPG